MLWCAVPVEKIDVILVIGFLILSLGIHEAAHAWVANLRGDSTAKDLGRLTLNPLVHIDPIMTIALPALLYWQGLPIFGGAKPVPVNYYNLRHPLRDMMLVAIAGPLSNFVLAILFSLAWNIMVGPMGMEEGALAPRVMWQSVWFNMLLAIFNMVPIPPLDGSRVMAWLLPSSLRQQYVALERFGFLILLAVFFLVGQQQLWDMLNKIMTPMLEVVKLLSGSALFGV